LSTAYEKGKIQMESLLKQEVYGTELRDTNERRGREVNIYTYLQIQELFAKKSKKVNHKSSKLNPIPISEPIIATSSLNNNTNITLNNSQILLQNTNTTNRKRQFELIQSEVNIKKKARRIVENSEKNILDSLAMNFLNSTPTDIAINETLTQLNETWDRESVLQYVRNARKRIKGKNVIRN
jgi:hypothetical protein